MKTITLLLIAMSIAFFSYGEHTGSKGPFKQLFDNTENKASKAWYEYAKISIDDIVTRFDEMGPEEFFKRINETPYPLPNSKVMHVIIYKGCTLKYHSKTKDLVDMDVCHKEELKELTVELKSLGKEKKTFGYTFYSQRDMFAILTVAKRTKKNYIITIEILLAGFRLKAGMLPKDWKPAVRKQLTFRLNDQIERTEMEKFHLVWK